MVFASFDLDPDRFVWQTWVFEKFWKRGSVGGWSRISHLNGGRMSLEEAKVIVMVVLYVYIVGRSSLHVSGALMLL